jgi:hypothetical protein
MAGSFGRFHLPTTRLWQRPIAMLRAKGAKRDGEKISMRLLVQQRLDALDEGTISALAAAPAGRPRRSSALVAGRRRWSKLRARRFRDP